MLEQSLGLHHSKMGHCQSQSRWAFLPWVHLAKYIGAGWNHLLPVLALGFALRSCRSQALGQDPQLASPRHQVVSSSCKDEGGPSKTFRGSMHCDLFPVNKERQ